MVNNLSFQYEGLNADSKKPHKKPGMVASTCNPSEGEVGGRGRWIFGAFWVASLAYLAKFPANGRP